MISIHLDTHNTNQQHRTNERMSRRPYLGGKRETLNGNDLRIFKSTYILYPQLETKLGCQSATNRPEQSSYLKGLTPTVWLIGPKFRSSASQFPEFLIHVKTSIGHVVISHVIPVRRVPQWGRSSQQLLLQLLRRDLQHSAWSSVVSDSSCSHLRQTQFV